MISCIIANISIFKKPQKAVVSGLNIVADNLSGVSHLLMCVFPTQEKEQTVYVAPVKHYITLFVHARREK